MKTLIVGGGGREHALAWGMAPSRRITELHAAPGNAGIASLATCHPVASDDVSEVVKLVDYIAADLVVVGPEAPLVAGLADAVRAHGVPVFGPEADAARLEGSKAWAKEVMVRGGIPTARAEVFDRVEPAIGFVDRLGGVAVIKADGLAAGKGVTVARDRDAAIAALRDCLEGHAFGDAGAVVVVEELIEGPEVSAFALVAHGAVVPLSLSQDFKRIGDGDTGPNTGGMGAYSPLPFVDERMEREIWTIVARTVATLSSMGVDYSGLLYTGLMLTDDGPKVLEYNCRFGDPETEAVIPRLRSDLAELLLATATGELAGVEVALSSEAAVTVVLASKGYPGSFERNVPIYGEDDAATMGGDAHVFHAATTRTPGGQLTTDGGRVMMVTGMGPTIADARSSAYLTAGSLLFENRYFRSDIAAAAAQLHREGT